MADRMDVGEMQATLHRVSAYRSVCEAVRGGAGHTIFNGLLYLGLAYFFGSQLARLHPLLESLFYAQLLLGGAEVLVGLWKRVRPSPEAVLLDAIVLTGFGLFILGRMAVLMNPPFNLPPQPVSILFGAWFLWDAWKAFGVYGQLRRAFRERPTPASLAYVDELAADILNADPATDPAAVDLPTFPRLKGKLLDGLAVFADRRNGGLFAAPAGDLRLTRVDPPGGGRAVGLLSIGGQEFPEFPLADATWANYERWKGGAGG